MFTVTGPAPPTSVWNLTAILHVHNPTTLSHILRPTKRVLTLTAILHVHNPTTLIESHPTTNQKSADANRHPRAQPHDVESHPTTNQKSVDANPPPRRSSRARTTSQKGAESAANSQRRTSRRPADHLLTTGPTEHGQETKYDASQRTTHQQHASAVTDTTANASCHRHN